MTIKKRSLSGIKPTGMPHLGNYLGMIKPAIALQDSYEACYFVADFHALTSVHNAKDLKEASVVITTYFLAFGLDPSKSAFFRQSAIPEVTELTWILSTVSNMGFLERAHAYKAAVDRNEAGDINVGVFTYPILMAADILIYDSDVVPVGKDQLQHVEMARDMANRFNYAFDSELLKLPTAIVEESTAVVPGTDGQKMSKSYGNILMPLASEKDLRKQVMQIQTDSTPLEEPKNPDTDTVFALYSLFAEEEQIKEMRSHYLGGNYGYGHAKQALFEVMNQTFAPARERYHELVKDHDYIEDVLAEGAKKVRPYVDEVMYRCRNACGFGGLFE